ncbi:MAG TPA: DNA repair protein [Pelagibacterium sp.]|uniref:ImuA family protein n=1 Tax=Pelagibacterium sp. TaxID=1967288 RepID=UPI002C21C278|nr:DNA repair protein [Pelagibacterium sp.]HWJ87350.1 DNA repair protein [Pelagibacterium sp.]
MNRAHRLGALRQALASLDPPVGAGQHGAFSLGAGPVDAALMGGLARGAVHEIFPTHAADIPAAAGFAMGLGLRAAPDRPLLWVRHQRVGLEAGALYAPGLAEAGLSPDRMVVVQAKDVVEGLRAALEALRCSGLGTVILESWGESRQLDLTASRRLSLAAEASGVTALMLRTMAAPEPSAAATRWSIAAAPSSDIANFPGKAAFSTELLRQRGGKAGWHWTLEWSHETRAFSQQQALSGAVAAPVFNGPAAPHLQTGWARAG